MTDIKVNKKIWDAIPEIDRQHITSHLYQYGVLKPGQQIVADANAPLPAITQHINDAIAKGDKNIRALGVDWICRAICNSTQAEADCVAHGQPLSACLATITGSREAYYAAVARK